MIENNELEQPIKVSKKGSKHESISDTEIISNISDSDVTGPIVEQSVSTITQQENKSDMKQKLSGLVHPSRIKTKKPQKVNLKLIKKIKSNPVNFF